MVETLFRRKVDLCCVQETRYRGGHCRIITDKDSRYKLFWPGNKKGTAGVGVFVAEKWIEKVFEVKRVSDRIILVKIIVGQRVLCLLSVYAPQCGLSDAVKDLFYDQLRAMTALIPASEFLIPCGDWNGHVGSTGSSYKEVHGGYGYGKPDPDSEGERILEYALAYDLFLGNTCFKKRDSHLIPGRVAQSVTCLATDACLTADPGVASSIPVRYHTSVEIDHEIISTVILLPSADLLKKGCCQLQGKVCAQITG